MVGLREEVAGLMVVAILSIAIVISLLAPAVGFTPSYRLEWPWMMAWGERRPVAQYEKGVDEMFNATSTVIFVDVSAGYVEVLCTNASYSYIVEVYGNTDVWPLGGVSYKVDEEVVDGVLRVESKVSAGVLKIYVNPAILQELKIYVSAGAGSLRLIGLSDADVDISVNAGSLDGELTYVSVSDAEVKVNVNAGSLDLDIEVPGEVKVCLQASSSASIVVAEVEGLGGLSLPSPGGQTLCDPDFTEGLRLTIDASSATVNINVRR